MVNSMEHTTLSTTRGSRSMDKRVGNRNLGEGVKDKNVRTTSDDAGGKSVIESKSTGGKMCETPQVGNLV